jgi:glycosyltransferase involved in cell wall biosynthesis
MQGYPNLEYIVVDGGSRDESVGLLEKYDDHLSYWVSEPDNGHAHAVNKGFAHCTGEILAWLNAGDIYFPHALRYIATVFQCFPEIDWLTSAHQGLQRTGQAAFTNYAPGFSRAFFLAGGYLGFESFSLGFIQQESTFWRRSLWEHTGGKLNEALRVAHDFDLWHRFFAVTKPALLDAPLGCFRSHPDQRSVTQRALYSEDAWAVLGRKGNPWLACMYGLFHRSRLARFMDWRTALVPFYGESIRYVTQSEAGQWQWQWRKLV